MNRIRIAMVGLVLTCGLAAVPATFAQVLRVRPGLIERAMPDFSLPSLDGRTVTLSQLKGRNVLLVFPRGRYDDWEWCQLCHYQYAELAELDAAQQFRTRYNVEVLFVLPYAKDVVEKWVTMFTEAMAAVDKWREESPATADRLPKKVAFRPGPAPRPSRFSTTPTWRCPGAWGCSPERGTAPRRTRTCRRCS